jgi:DNA modification methylase
MESLTAGLRRSIRKLHPHIKPIGLITRLIGAVTAPGELVIDPAAGSFAVMHAAHELGREFVGCDIAFNNPAIEIAQFAERNKKEDSV